MVIWVLVALLAALYLKWRILLQETSSLWLEFQLLSQDQNNGGLYDEEGIEQADEVIFNLDCSL